MFTWKYKIYCRNDSFKNPSYTVLVSHAGVDTMFDAQFRMFSSEKLHIYGLYQMLQDFAESSLEQYNDKNLYTKIWKPLSWV